MVITVTVTLDLDLPALDSRTITDEAIQKVTFRRKTYTVREANLDLAGDRADISQEGAAAALARQDGSIAGKQAELTATGLSADKRQLLTEELTLLQAQRPAIARRVAALNGLDRFLDSLDLGVADAMEAVLTAVLAALTAHRATLPA